jgi:hypothetical protein
MSRATLQLFSLRKAPRKDSCINLPLIISQSMFRNTLSPKKLLLKPSVEKGTLEIKTRTLKVITISHHHFYYTECQRL